MQFAMGRFWMVVCALVCVMAAGINAGAQTGTSRATGQVLDPSGAAVSGASVTLTNEATGIEYKSTTTEAGTYLYDALPPGKYTIQIEKQGFRNYISRENVLTVGTPLTLNVKLDVGEANSTVEVTSTYERVQTSTSGNLGAIVDNKTLTDLPLGLDVSTGGRNPLVFSHLQPGVNVGANSGGGVHFNGARDRAVNYTLDGIDINESSAGGSDFSPLRTNPDGLQEFRVITSNATAEYGRSSGAQVELVTKSGTNQIHGNLFYFHRNNGFSANEWENNLLGIPRPKLIQNQWGGSVGGPAIKNRTFYFFDYQQQRQVRPYTRTRTVYTEQARRGIFRYVAGGQNTNASGKKPSVDAGGRPLFPDCGGAITTNCIATYNIVANDPRGLGLDPMIRDKWIGITPLPNTFSGAGDGLNSAGFQFSGGRLDPQRDYIFKIDHHFNDNNSVYGRYGWGYQNTLNDTGNGGEPRFPGLPTIVNTNRSPRNLALGYRRVINSHMVNELIAGANHFTFDFDQPNAGKTLPISLVNVTDPNTNDKANLRTINTYQVIDNFSYNVGAHNFRAGINFRITQHRDVRGSVGGFDSELEIPLGGTVNANCLSGKAGTDASGSEFFCLPTISAAGINATDRGRLSGAINDLLGRVLALQRGFVATSDLKSFAPAGTTFLSDVRFPEYDFYGQDTWKWKPNFTIDVGLRVEIQAHPTSPKNLLFEPNQAVRVGENPSNTLKWVRGPLYGNDFKNIEPSIGFAWDPFRTGKTSVRANYRLAADRINTFVLSSQIFNSVPGLTLGVQNLAFGQNGGPGGTAGRFRDNLPAVAPPAGIVPELLTQPAAFGTTGITAVDPAFHAPHTNMWQLSVQREAWRGIVIDIAYIGRHATGLLGAYDVNQVDYRNNGFLDAFQIVQSGGQSALMNRIYSGDSRLKGTETGSELVRRLFPNPVKNGSVASVANDAATRNENGRSLLDLAGLSPFFFKPYPQFSGSFRVLDANDYSNYHALQLTVSRKFATGVTFQGAYTFGKSLDVRSFDPTFTVVAGGTGQAAGSSPFDIRNRRLNYARSDFDRRHIFTGYAIWDLPIGANHYIGGSAPGWLRWVIEGWQINGDFTIESGRPFTVYSGFNQFSNVVSAPANCNLCTTDMGHVDKSSAVFGGVPGFFSAADIAKFSQPGPGELGNTGRNFFTGPRFFNIDAALLKRTKIGESRNIELRLEAFNATNTPSFGFPGAVIPATGDTSVAFGRIRDNVESSSRKLRIGIKLNF